MTKKSGEGGKSGQKNYWVLIPIFGTALVVLGLARIDLAGFDVEVYPWSAEAYLWNVIFAIVLIMGATAVISSSARFSSKKGLPALEKSRLPMFLASVDLALIILGVTAILALGAGFPMWEQGSWFFHFNGLVLVALIVAGSGAFLAFMGAQRREFAVPRNVLDSLQQVEPDKSFETKDFFVFKKGPIYILLKKMFIGAHFVKLFKETPVSDKKVRLPFLRSMIARRKASKFQIDDLDLLAVRGDFTILVDTVRRGDRTEERYVSGPGILYYATVFPTVRSGLRSFRFLDDSAMLDRLAILKILEELSKEEPKRSELAYV